MSENAKKKIHLIYGICLSVLLTVVAVCFIFACVDIYQSGSMPFTRESIGSHFKTIAIPVYLCIALIIGGWILHLALPVEPKKIRGKISPHVALDRLLTRLDMTACDQETRNAITRERKLRRLLTIIAAAVWIIATAIGLVYISDIDRFQLVTANHDIKKAVLIILPGTLAALGVCIAVTFLSSASIKRETKTVKSAIVAGYMIKGEVEKPAPADRSRAILITRIAVLTVALVFIVAGIINGGMSDVFAKAIRICTECIGLG